jgi:hypothetical protein
VVTYDGSSWSSPDEINAGNMTSVSCPTSSFCAAVTFGGEVVIYDGSSWSSPEGVDAAGALNSVSCPTASFCVAVDEYGNVLTYNGSSWSSSESINGGAYLMSVSCPTTSFCAAVGENGKALTYSGSSWSSPDNIDARNWLNSVSCPTASFCAAVDPSRAFTYPAPAVTLTQGNPTSARVADGAGYKGRLTVTNGTGAVSYTETSSTDSNDVVVTSTGTIRAATSLAPGTYAVRGTDRDTNGGTGAWSFVLTVGKATTKTALKLSATDVTYGHEQIERLSVTVSSQHSGSTPTGMVAIKASATTLCVIKLKSAKGSCSLSAQRLKTGTYHLVATYDGSVNFKGSTSTKETLTVAT